MDEHVNQQPNEGTNEHAEEVLSPPGSGDVPHVSPGSPGSPGVTAQGSTDRETELRRLALRLLRAMSGEEPHDLQLLPGELPPNLPFGLPLPPDARIVGALVGGRAIRVVLDTNLSPDGVFAYYRERLSAAGWIEPEVPMGGRRIGGFVDTFIPPQPQRYTVAFSRQTWALFVVVAASGGGEGRAGSAGSGMGGEGEGGGDGGGGPTDVQLVLRADPPPWYHYPRGPRRAQQISFDPSELIPPLTPPSGARQRSTGGGGGSDDWRSSARLETELDVAAIMSHYAQQLEHADWTRRGAEECGATAWSAWDFTDEDGEPWRGLLMAIRWPAAPGAAEAPAGVEAPGARTVYLLDLHVLWAGDEPDPFFSPP